MESAATVVEDAHLGAGVLLNFLLLFAIRRFTKKSLGTYKQLLTIFAAFDIFLTVLHAVVKPKVVIVGTTFGVIGNFEDIRVNSIYCACFTVPFALMIIHFLYRFWSIRYPHLIGLFSNKKFIVLITLYPNVALVVWYLIAYYGSTGQEDEIGKTMLREETINRFGREYKDGWLIINHWEDGVFSGRAFYVMCSVDITMIISFSIATTLAVLTFHYIRRAGADAISLQSNNMQLKLFIAVCAQTFVPVVFVYIPYFCVLNFPLFHLPIYSLDDACMILTSCFPAWDAVIMILLMKDFREGLTSMSRKKKAVQLETTWKTSSSIMPSTVYTIH